MISIALTHRRPASSPSLVMSILMGLRRRRIRAIQRKHLLSLDDYLLRDMGLNRLDVMRGNF
ncbi:MAG TPA: DUF1127 domain-containing protein [Aestuariivirga sp.]|nr:DUF1127 domain-containing protein [Hyphomicrobiales bacterium]HQY73572.1 DUF1127 domain-containing protein [Aestuariivirga sp.]MBP9174550.1 DUF1127 domain-containing protein [Hyphomicrobiales bacterium]MBZ0262750.1 DUF1127 domain-containing protein [Hyphomicrobiales bacterium]MCC7481891.1 DUF1127 domain-containing protein [Hyphomicrobiales bacterium]